MLQPEQLMNSMVAISMDVQSAFCLKPLTNSVVVQWVNYMPRPWIGQTT